MLNLLKILVSRMVMKRRINKQNTSQRLSIKIFIWDTNLGLLGTLSKLVQMNLYMNVKLEELKQKIMVLAWLIVIRLPIIPDLLCSVE